MLRPSILATVLLSSAIAPSLAAEGGRSIILVLDASGSMNARLPDSATRIDAAKAAVADVVGKVAPGTRHRMYRAHANEHFVLGEREERVRVAL